MNYDIKKLIHDSDLKFWQIAQKLSCNDGNFSRKLRRELSNEEKEIIIKIVNDLRKESTNYGKNQNFTKSNYRT